MGRVNQSRIHLLLFFFLLISGCAPVISPELRAKVDTSVSFEEVLQNPDKYKGKIVLWGGEILQVLPQDETTYIEILEKPLGWREKPEASFAPRGKFLIRTRELLDFSRFKIKEKVTVAGEIEGSIQGEKIQSGDKSYRYPVISSKEIHLWKSLYAYSNPLPPHDIWWYDPAGQEFRY
jgi:outer membrane lipoprotein